MRNEIYYNLRIMKLIIEKAMEAVNDCDTRTLNDCMCDISTCKRNLSKNIRVYIRDWHNSNSEENEQFED